MLNGYETFRARGASHRRHTLRGRFCVNSTDDDLVSLAMAGNRPAFDVLVRHTSRLVWAHHILRTRDRALAEDLTQETYLRAWRAIRSLSDASLFRSWLLTIAESVRLDDIKHRTRRKRAAPTAMDEPADVPSGDPTPSEQAERAELSNQALEALFSLPSQYQQPLALRYLAGADYAEISKQLALTNGSLRGLLHRGLEMLRERLAGDVAAS
jgi:RNA polymerase sigma-70 factor (ECF subfamily)